MLERALVIDHWLSGLKLSVPLLAIFITAYRNLKENQQNDRQDTATGKRRRIEEITQTASCLN